MLIVEDGSGNADANSYVTLEFADNYFSARGQGSLMLVTENVDDDVNFINMWSGIPRNKSAALVRATDHIDAVYGAHFLNSKLTLTQALAFPRTEINGIPLVLKKATCLYALRALGGHLIPDTTSSNENISTEVTSGNIAKKREKIGPIEEETEFFKPSSGDKNTIIYYHDVLTPKAYPEADLMLKTLLKPEAIISPSHNNNKDCIDKNIGTFGTGYIFR